MPQTFVERTFQRTLVELNKLISFSGTPTVVWRRTGEICLVGTEFCLLTGWKREELVGKKYIFEVRAHVLDHCERPTLTPKVHRNSSLTRPQ